MPEMDQAATANSPDHAGCPQEEAHGLDIGAWRVLPGLNRIRNGTTERALEPRAMDTLVFLARHAGTTCSREQILDAVWGTRSVVDGVVTKTISELRRALDDDAQQPRYIQTISRRGYRLLIQVGNVRQEAATARPADDRQPNPPRPIARRRVPGVLAALLVLAGVSYLLATLFPGDDLQTGPASQSIRSVGVIEFEYVGDPRHDHFGRGFSEQITVALAQTDRVRVFGPSGMGAAPIRSTGSPTPPVVDAVVAGSVWSENDQVRINAHVTRTADREVIWARQIEFPAREAFSALSILAAQIGAGIGLPPDQELRVALAARGSTDAEAYFAYLRARQLWRERDRDDLLRAHDLLRSAIDKDPTFALAHAALADTYLALVNYRVLSRQSGFEQASSAAQRALTLAPNLPEVHTSLGSVRLNAHWDFQGARASFEQALAINASDATAYQWYAECLSILGEHEQARAAIAHAIELEPGSPLMYAVAGLIEFGAGKLDDALERFDTALDLHPRFTWLHRYRSDALLQIGQPDQALAARIELLRADGVAETAIATMREQVQAAGMSAFWAWELDRLQALTSSGQTVEIALLAEALAANGRIDDAMGAIEQIVQMRGEYFLLLRRSSSFDALASDDRYLRLLAGLGLSATSLTRSHRGRLDR